MDSDNTGYGIFETGIYKWDHWQENGKYLISYDDSQFTNKDERRTIEKALNTLESVTSLKFVKYDPYTCSLGDKCSWYILFVRSKKAFLASIGREKKAGPHDIQLLVGRGSKNPMAEEKNYFYVVHEV